MKTFCETYKLRNLIKESTCFKNPKNPTCIDLLLTNKSLSFKNTYVIETKLSDFHKMAVGAMKMHFPKMKPRVIRHQKYKGYHNETSLDSLRHELSIQGRFLNEKRLDAFSTICTELLINMLLKKRYIRSNHKPFINNEISKAIMTRTRLRDQFLQHRSDENRKQRNKCV